MTPDSDSRLNLLELKCRRPVEHLLAGEYRSVFKGRGIEFEDVRPYAPGDDVRAMDWKVTARTGVPHVKRYVEEREQYFFLLVDLSASALSDSGGTKRNTLVELCSLLTLAALKNNDRVGLILFSEEVELVVPPGKGRLHGIRIMDAVATFQPKGKGTNLSAALNALGHLARKRSVAFLMSDFLGDGFEDELRSVAYLHDLIAVSLLEPQELKVPDCGLVRIEDAETEEVRVLDFSSGEAGSSRSEALRRLMLDCSVDLVEIVAGEDCVAALSQFFRSRQRLVADETGG
ncbi:DUF58 domain-containing protein [Pelagicoccus sp. SDUM812005]|uniref:DUF58 domain-containing protein n=1 Tax=Pelagicoccus sp. SDUM812005 TaxID=3041257 RepID=UPI00280C6B86|nr:DUF58 domain-containing protein [Pelagicoccus sp. SDUM812005]MDQ8183577.1 DUF58 domain-containing protein [Pelagicoccus sp. SDUM812005]